MSMRCNLLGHSYGDEEERVETNDEEDGDIRIKKKVQECERCGNERVLNENKSLRPSESTQRESETQTNNESESIGMTDSGQLDHGYNHGTDDALLMGDTDKEDLETDDTSGDSAEAIEESFSESTSVNSDEGVAIMTDDSTSEPESSESDSDASQPDTDNDDSHTRKGVEILSEEENEESQAAPDNSEVSSDGEETTATEDIGDIPNDVSETDDSAIAWKGTQSSTESPSSENPTESGAISDSDSTPNQSATVLTSTQTTTENQSQTAKPSHPSGGKTVECPDCGFSKNQYVANTVAGDACPSCRTAYLEWGEDSEK